MLESDPMKQHCCAPMTEMVNHTCPQHANLFACPDHLVYYVSQFDEYGLIIHDGGAAFVAIVFWRWCGRQLRESKRVLWLTQLAAQGFDKTLEQEIPDDYRSGEWYAQRPSGT
ncbi:MAG: hypothetical protein V7641_5613 [Blastocatellia bacterium]